MERFEDIEGWQLARELTQKVYFKDIYDLAGRTRGTIHGFIKYLKKYEEPKNVNGVALNPELRNQIQRPTFNSQLPTSNENTPHLGVRRWTLVVGRSFLMFRSIWRPAPAAPLNGEP